MPTLAGAHCLKHIAQASCRGDGYAVHGQALDLQGGGQQAHASHGSRRMHHMAVGGSQPMLQHLGDPGSRGAFVRPRLGNASNVCVRECAPGGDTRVSIPSRRRPHLSEIGRALYKRSQLLVLATCGRQRHQIGVAIQGRDGPPLKRRCSPPPGQRCTLGVPQADALKAPLRRLPAKGFCMGIDASLISAAAKRPAPNSRSPRFRLPGNKSAFSLVRLMSTSPRRFSTKNSGSGRSG